VLRSYNSSWSPTTAVIALDKIKKIILKVVRGYNGDWSPTTVVVAP